MTCDLRLVPTAVTVWAVSLAGLWWGWPFAWLTGAVAVATAVVVAICSLRWRPAAVLVVLLGAVGTCWIASVVRGSAEHPLRASADLGSVATLRVEVSDWPRAMSTAGFGGRQGGTDRVIVPAKVTGGDVLVLASASGWAELLPGQELTVTGRLAPARSGDLTLAVVQARGSPSAVTPAPVWQRAAASLRTGLRQSTAAVLDPEPAGLLPALVVGDTGALSQRVVDEWKAAGLAHLTVVGGSNLAIVCGAVLAAMRLVGAGPRLSGAVAGLALVGFLLLTGPDPSMLRAAVMGAIGLLAIVLGRERSALSALAVAVIGLLLLNPGFGLNAAFALSVQATAALVVLAPRWASALCRRGVPPGVAEAIAMPAAAHLVTAPVIAGLSGQVSLVAVVANLLAEPVVAPATVLGVLVCVAAPIHQGTAEMLARIAGPETSWLVWVGRHAAGLPMASVSWPGGWGGGLLLVGLIAAAVLVVRSRRLRAVAAAVLVGVVLVLLPVRLSGSGWPPTGWAMVGCDVGQGDALVLATADPGRAVLIDTGPDLSSVVDCLRRLGVNRIPLVILSHFHADHIGGLSSVLSDFTVGAVGVGPLHEPAWAWEQVQRVTRDAAVPLVDVVAGQRLEWSGLSMEVIGPRQVPTTLGPNAAGTPVNDASLVLRATTTAGRILLTGDAELEGQAELLASREDLAAEVLKVPHHGSRYSLPRFLERVHPRVAVVSVGAGNTFGHPSPIVLNALTAEGAAVLRTDNDGDIAVLPGPDGPQISRRGEPRAPPHR